MGIKKLEEMFPRDFFESDLIGLSESEKIAMILKLILVN